MQKNITQHNATYRILNKNIKNFNLYFFHYIYPTQY